MLLPDFLQATLVLCLGEGAGAYFNGRLCRACPEFVWSLQLGGSVLVGKRNALTGRTLSKEEHMAWRGVSASSVKATKSRNMDGWNSRIGWGTEIRNLLLADGLGFPDGFVGKKSACVSCIAGGFGRRRQTGVRSLGREDLLEEEMATHSSVLAWRIPWTEEPGGYSPQCHESDTAECVHSCSL